MVEAEWECLMSLREAEQQYGVIEHITMTWRGEMIDGEKFWATIAELERVDRFQQRGMKDASPHAPEP